MDEQQRLCPSCGMPNAAHAAVCATCGRPLAATAPTRQAPAAGTPSAEGSMLPPPPTPARPVPPPPPPPPPTAAPPPPAAAPAPSSPAPPAATPPPMASAPPPPAAYPPPMAPVPFPLERPLTSGQKTGQFFGGLGLGLAGFAAIVLLTILANGALFRLAGSSGVNVTPYVPIVLFLALIGVMAYLLAKPRVRWLGYGLLAAIVALPVIAVVGCVVIISVSFRSA